MTCAVCNALYQEYTHECELEAKEILSQKPALFAMSRKPAEVPDSSSVERIIISRKRQMELATKIDEHKARAHVA